MEAAAEIARAAAHAWLAPLLDTACDRLAFVLQSLFDLAVERSRTYESHCKCLFFDVVFVLYFTGMVNNTKSGLFVFNIMVWARCLVLI